MTRIAFILAVFLAAGSPEIPAQAQSVQPNSSASTASISGIIKYSGRVPRPAFEGFPPEDEAEDPAARPLINAFVYLEKLDDAGEPVPGDPDGGEGLDSAQMDQRGFRFRPQVQVVQAGQDLIFGNNDLTNHNVRGNTKNPRNVFNVIMKHERLVTKNFEFQGNNSPIHITCDFHPSMEAWVYIVDHPRYAVTTEDGLFEIGNLEPGQYRFHITQPIHRVRAEADLTIEAGEAVQVRVTFGIPHKYYRSLPPIRIERKTP